MQRRRGWKDSLKPAQQKEALLALLPRRSLRCGGLSPICPCDPGPVVQTKRVQRGLHEALGKNGHWRLRGNDERPEEARRTWRGRRWKAEESGAQEKARRCWEEAQQKRESEACARKKGRDWSKEERCLEGKAGEPEREPGWKNSRRRQHGRGLRFFRRGAKSKRQRSSSFGGRPRERRPRYRQSCASTGLDGQDGARAREGQGHKADKDAKGPCVTAAGESRADEDKGRSRGEEGKEEEEKERSRRRKGKGVGGTSDRGRREGEERREAEESKRKEEEEEERILERRGRAKLRSLRPGGRRGEGRGRFFEQLRRVPSPAAEEICEEARNGAENARAPCKGRDGSEQRGGDWGDRQCDRRGEDLVLLQPDGASLPQQQLQRHEGDEPPGSLLGRTSCGAAGTARGFLSVKVLSNPHAGKRRKLESSAIPGDAPTRTSSGSTYQPAPRSAEAWKNSGKEPWKREVAKVSGRPKRLFRLGECSRRKRKRQGEAERRRKERAEGRRMVSAEPKAELARERLVAEQERQPGEEGRSRREGCQEQGEVKEDKTEREEGKGSEDEFLKKGLQAFGKLANEGCSLKKVGILLAWLAVRAGHEKETRMVSVALKNLMPALGAGNCAVHRSRKRETFPIRIGELAALADKLAAYSFKKVCAEDFIVSNFVDAWTLLSIFFVNFLHGSRVLPRGSWRKTDRAAVQNLRAACERSLRLDENKPRRLDEIEKELSSRFVSYTGEEIPKMEPLTLAQVSPALPPVGHGGCIPVVNWTKGRTRSFLLHPEECLRTDDGRELPKLQAKVHVAEEDKMKLAALLVERNICSWIPLADVVEYRGQKVLSGLFGVAKSSTLDDGRPHLRVIMNLIPANAILHQLDGPIRDLPGITQYQSLILEGEERAVLFQSDMTSAFYLFSLPKEWCRFLSFNLVVDGGMIGYGVGTSYCLACSVLPMGWSSAVSVMQEVSSNLLLDQNFPPQGQVTRTKPLPSWLTEVLSTSKSVSRSWWHIYLDNFFAGERVESGESRGEGSRLHALAEKCWNDAGVLSSEKKKIREAEEVQELGAELDGVGRLLGGSAQRLLRVVQTTLFLLSRDFVPTKWLQVICGRWVHILQFRRVGMASLHWVWKWIGGKRISGKQRMKARRELLMLCFGACLFHTHLGAKVSPLATASDASNTGGAVGAASELSDSGRDLCDTLRKLPEGVTKVPVIVISLFNGVGGCFRCYDIISAEPMGLVSFDTYKPANRITSRRWPHALIKTDVREFDEKFAYELLLKFPHALAIHLWGGFPCVDLSAVKAFRRNLRGSESGLFFEVTRIFKLLKRVFGRRFPVIHIIENVSSMDVEARDEISAALGTEPYKVQCSDAVPISRPRFCWLSEELEALPGIRVIHKEGFKVSPDRSLAH